MEKNKFIKVMGILALFFATIMSVNAISGNDADLLAHWTLVNELTDSSGNGHTLTSTGATSVSSGCPNGYSNCYDFDGSNDYMQAVGFNNDSNSITWGGWYYFGTNTSANSDLIGKYNSGGKAGLHLSAEATKKIRAYCGGSNFVDYASDVGLNNEHHIVFKVLNNNMEIYLNGSLVQNSSCISSTNTEDWFLGATTGTGNFYDGTMNHIAIWDKALSNTEINDWYANGIVYDTAPSFISYNISNSVPVRTNDIIDVNFKVNNQSLDTNVSVTWFKSTDGGSTYTNHASDNETFTNVLNNTQYNTNSAGDLEAVDTTAFEWWKAKLTATNSEGSTTVNTTAVYIDNAVPEITYSDSGTTNDNPADVGDTITFLVNGTDVEEDTVKLKVCSNSDRNWSNCDVLAQNLTGVSWSSTVNTSITAIHTANETTRNNTGYAIVYDGGNYSYTNITYYVNQFPTLSNLTYVDTSADSTFYFKENMDYFKINMNDSYNGTSLTPYLTIYDPDNVIKVNNQSMSLSSGTQFEYTNDLLLDAVGTWNATIRVTDSDGATTQLSESFTVQSSNTTSLGRIYAYDTGEWSNYTYIDDIITSYGYYAVEIHINNSVMDNNWTQFKQTVGEVKNNSQLVIITLDDDLSNQSGTIDNLNTTYDDLITGDYLNGILMLKIDTQGASNTTSNTNALNNITKKMFQETNNNFPIYIKDYQSTDIDENYATEDPYTYISTNNRTTYVNEEISLLRTSTDKSRFYNNLSDSFKGYARDWQNNVIDKIRSGINISTTYSSNIAELNNLDIIVSNNQSTQQTYQITSVDSTNGKDIYDLSNKSIIELDTDKTFNITLEPYSANLLYFTDLSKLVVNDEGEINLFGSSLTDYPKNESFGGIADEAFQFVSGSTNPDDGRIFLTDPTFNEMDFYVWYGQSGAEAIADWSRYNKTIIADENETFVDNIVNQTSLFGYSAVNDYGDNNEPDGCVSGVNCTSWNRTKWLNNEKDEIDTWTDMNGQINIFLDGLDIGTVNDVDGLFDDALVELSDYIRITKQRELILNTYTAYQDYANLGDYTMRESACARWDGTESDPTYSYEDLETEKERASFHKTHNIPVLAQTFGNITDYEKSYYCFMQTKTLYGDLAQYSYNQPTFDYTGADEDFYWNYYVYPELGAQLEDDYTEEGSDVLTRRFENGIVSVNTTAKTVDFENNLNVQEITHCAYYYDNDDGGNDEGQMHYVINDNLSKSFDVYDTNLTAFQKTWVCKDIGTDLYEPSGWYELEFYYLDSDGNYIGNSGLFMYHGDNSSQDELSGFDQTLNDHPSNDETDYTSFGRGDNWAMEFHINATAEKTIDDVSSSITRTETGTEVKNITLSSTTDWDLQIYDKQVFLNKSQFNDLTVNGTELNVYYDSSCNTNNPTYNKTQINGYNWSACYYNATGGGYNFNVIVPHLSTQTYLVDGNTYPTVDSQSIDINNLIDGFQNLTIDFNVSDADNNTITSCEVDINGTKTSGTYSDGTCSVTLSTNLNASTQIFTPIVTDENDGKGNGTTYNSMTSVFDKFTWDANSTTSNQSIQYFWNRYNLTYDWDKNFSSISWSINTSFDEVSIGLVNGTNQERFENNYDLITEDNYTLVTDANDTYFVNSGETIYKDFNLTNNLGSAIPEFNISYVPTRYTSGSQTLTKYNGSDWNIINFTSSNPILFTASSINDNNVSQYNISYKSKVIYTTNDTLVFTQSGDIRTYFWNSTDNLGLKYNFMFDELLGTSNSIFHNIAYSDITNWDIRDSSSNQFKDQDENTLVQGSDYTLTDTPASDLLVLNFAPLSGDTHYRFNLTYSATVESEEEDTGGTGGGGGGGGGSPTPVDDLQDSDKQSCSISVTPKDLEIINNDVVKLTISNNENFGLDPEFIFEYVSGDESINNRLQTFNTISFIDANKQSSVSIGLGGIVEKKGNVTSNLYIKTTKCKNVIVPIKVQVTTTNFAGELLDEFDEKTFVNILQDSLKDRLGGDETQEPQGFIEKLIQTVGGWVLMISTIWAIVLLPVGSYTRFSQNKFLDIVLRFVLFGILVFITYIGVRLVEYFLLT